MKQFLLVTTLILSAVTASAAKLVGTCELTKAGQKIRTPIRFFEEPHMYYGSLARNSFGPYELWIQAGFTTNPVHFGQYKGDELMISISDQTLRLYHVCKIPTLALTRGDSASCSFGDWSGKDSLSCEIHVAQGL